MSLSPKPALHEHKLKRTKFSFPTIPPWKLKLHRSVIRISKRKVNWTSHRTSNSRDILRAICEFRSSGIKEFIQEIHPVHRSSAPISWRKGPLPWPSLPETLLRSIDFPHCLWYRISILRELYNAWYASLLPRFAHIIIGVFRMSSNTQVSRYSSYDVDDDEITTNHISNLPPNHQTFTNHLLPKSTKYPCLLSTIHGRTFSPCSRPLDPRMARSELKSIARPKSRILCFWLSKNQP